MQNAREHSFSGVEIRTSATSAEEIVAEARHGLRLARELVEHLNRMQAEGYSNEIQVDGQSWKLEVHRSSLPS